MSYSHKQGTVADCRCKQWRECVHESYRPKFLTPPAAQPASSGISGCAQISTSCLIKHLPWRVKRTHAHAHRRPHPPPPFLQKKESWNLCIHVGHGIVMSGDPSCLNTQWEQMGCEQPHINQKATFAPYLEGYSFSRVGKKALCILSVPCSTHTYFWQNKKPRKEKNASRPATRIRHASDHAEIWKLTALDRRGCQHFSLSPLRRASMVALSQGAESSRAGPATLQRNLIMQLATGTSLPTTYRVQACV